MNLYQHAPLNKQLNINNNANHLINTLIIIFNQQQFYTDVELEFYNIIIIIIDINYYNYNKL